MRYGRTAFRALYRLISEGQVDDGEAFSIARCIFNPEYVQVPVFPPSQADTSGEVERVTVRGFQAE